LFQHGKLAPPDVVDTSGFEHVRLVSDDADPASEAQHLQWVRAMNFSAFYHTEVREHFPQ
jgi:hypothetical protein